MDKEELVKQVPVACPFCIATDNVNWSEFKVQFYEEHYVDSGNIGERVLEEGIVVFCTRCGEHIRPEDMV